MILGRIPSAFGRREARALIVVVALSIATATGFALNFPALTGRVVDQANISDFIASSCGVSSSANAALCPSRTGRADAAPRRARRAIAYQVAMEQFVSRGLARNRNQSDVLIFVSLVERYARIIVGTEIAARVPQARWQAAVDALIAHMRNGLIADGFIAAIEMCGQALAKHFPASAADRNELPDRIYLI
jgi:putative membrane protein